MSFGAKLAKYRKRAGMTQEALGMKIGIHMQSVTDLERGKIKPRIETFARIRVTLNLSPEETVDLLEEINQPAEVGR